MNLKNWEQNEPSNSPKALGTKSKFEKQRVHREVLAKSVRLEERPHEETLHQERCAHKAAWDLAKNIFKLENSGKTMLYVPGEKKEMPAPTASKRPEEREFVVDSGASMHMMSKKELSSEEMGTVKSSRKPTAVLTASGKVHTHEEAQVFVHDLNQFVTVQLLEETPAVLSLGNLCEDHGYSNE